MEVLVGMNGQQVGKVSFNQDYIDIMPNPLMPGTGPIRVLKANNPEGIEFYFANIIQEDNKTEK